ncbi:hypothetical protein F5880DRAFT_1545495 [Lentinula raphanica]|nr:hypothetical protein F5880DRAFT_1545495 [Lentinula raphanica]
MRLFFSVCLGNFTDKDLLFVTLPSLPNDCHLPLLVKEKKSSTFVLPQKSRLHHPSSIYYSHTYSRSLSNMRSNSSAFYALMCLSAILHIVCGSPVPQAPSSSSDQGRDSPPPGQSTSNGHPTRPVDVITVLPPMQGRSELHPSIPFDILTPLLDNHVNPGVNLYARTKLKSLFPEIDVPPDDAVDCVHIDHSSGKDPLPLIRSINAETELVAYLYDFYLHRGTPQIHGTAHVILAIVKGQDGHPKVDRSRSGMDIYLNPLSRYSRSDNLLRIGSVRKRSITRMV